MDRGERTFGRDLRQACLTFFLLAATSGCAPVGPDYVTPGMDLPQKWNSVEQKQQSEEKSLTSWWRSLNDPVIDQLIEEAIKSNFELNQARSRVRQARLQSARAGAQFSPTLGLSGTAKNRGQDTEELGSSENHAYSVGLDASWEIDIFGGVRRNAEAVVSEYQAEVESLHDVLVSLLAEVVLNYIDLRTCQHRLEAVEANVSWQQQTVDLVQAMVDSGIGDERELAYAISTLESSRARIPALQLGIENAKNRLAVLVGKPAGKLHARLSQIKPLPRISSYTAVGIPADMVRQRPDIRQAERELAAQTARIGLAEADLYPRFFLSGSIGLESVTSRSFLSTADRTWTWGPSFSWPVFDAGTIRKNIAIQEELQQQALLNYQTSVLQALEEVENGLVAFHGEQQVQASLARAVKQAGVAAALADQEYSTGIGDFSDVIDAQKSLISLEDQLHQSNGDVLVRLVGLYKAMGGGWQPFDYNGALGKSDKGK